MLAPFLPAQFDKKNIPKVAFTPLFVSYTIFFFITSIFAGKMQGNMLFLVVGFFGRIIQGIGVGLLQTAQFGAICGFLISAFLSYVLGFIGPFAFFGMVFLVFGVFQNQLINFVNVNESNLNERKPSISTMEPVIRQSFKEVNRDTLKDSNIHPYLRNEGAIQTLIYDSVQQQPDTQQNNDQQLLYKSIIQTQTPSQQEDIQEQLLVKSNINNLQQKDSYDNLNYFHVLGTSRGLFAFLDHVWITMLGFTISGLASPFTIVPPYKELENSLVKYDSQKKFDPEAVQDVVSGLFNSAYALGGITGPTFGGYRLCSF
eukprot:403370445